MSTPIRARRLFSAVAAAFLFAACSKAPEPPREASKQSEQPAPAPPKAPALTRETAAKILKNSLRMPQFEMTSVQKHFLKESSGSGLCSFGTGEEQRRAAEALRKKGLVFFGADIVQNNDLCRSRHGTVQLTAEGKKYLVKESRDFYAVREYQKDFGNITGIVLDEHAKHARVEYTITRTATPFAPQNSLTHENYTDTLVLYDDGWRLVR